MEHVRSELKQYRQERGLSQTQLADILGVNRQTIITMESDNGGDPRTSTVRRILAYFEITFEELFPEDDDSKCLL